MSPEQTTADTNKEISLENESRAAAVNSLTSGSNKTDIVEAEEEAAEEYIPTDWRCFSEYTQASAHRLERRLKGLTTSEARQKALHRILDIQEDGYGNDTLIYIAYLRRNRRDIPENPEWEQRFEAEIRNTASIGHYKGRHFSVAKRQRNHFGGWSWPKEKADGSLPAAQLMNVGPKWECVTPVANPPRGSTWKNIATEQRENAAANWPINDGPKGEYVRQVVDPPAGSTWEAILIEQRRNAAAFRRKILS